MISYKEYHPGEKLAPYIKCFWTYEHMLEGIKIQEIAFTKGFLNLVFIRNGSFAATWPDTKSIEIKQSIVAPHLSVPALLEYTSNFSIVGVTIYPWANPIVLKHPSFYFTDQFLSAEEVYGSKCNEICDSIKGEDIILILQGLKRFFGKLVDETIVDGPMKYAVKAIANSQGRVEMNGLAKNLNLSSRRIQQKFHESIGFGPKYFARVIRFRQIITKLSTQKESSLTSLAYDLDYADQSHMIKEFKHFTGLAPLKYMKYLDSSDQLMRTLQSEIRRDSC